MLHKARVLEISGNKMEIEATDNSFQYKKLSKSTDQIEQACRALFGFDPEIVVKANESEQADYRTKIDMENRLRNEALNHPLVRDAMEIFSGEVIDVKILKEDHS